MRLLNQVSDLEDQDRYKLANKYTFETIEKAFEKFQTTTIQKSTIAFFFDACKRITSNASTPSSNEGDTDTQSSQNTSQPSLQEDIVNQTISDQEKFVRSTFLSVFGENHYRNWFKHVDFDLKDGQLTILAPNAFFRDFIEREFLIPLRFQQALKPMKKTLGIAKIDIKEAKVEVGASLASCSASQSFEELKRHETIWQSVLESEWQSEDEEQPFVLDGTTLWVQNADLQHQLFKNLDKENQLNLGINAIKSLNSEDSADQQPALDTIEEEVEHQIQNEHIDAVTRLLQPFRGLTSFDVLSLAHQFSLKSIQGCVEYFHETQSRVRSQQGFFFYYAEFFESKRQTAQEMLEEENELLLEAAFDGPNLAQNKQETTSEPKIVETLREAILASETKKPPIGNQKTWNNEALKTMSQLFGKDAMVDCFDPPKPIPSRSHAPP